MEGARQKGYYNKLQQHNSLQQIRRQAEGVITFEHKTSHHTLEQMIQSLGI